MIGFVSHYTITKREYGIIVIFLGGCGAAKKNKISIVAARQL
jgi:hypothetical protein